MKTWIASAALAAAALSFGAPAASAQMPGGSVASNWRYSQPSCGRYYTPGTHYSDPYRYSQPGFRYRVSPHRNYGYSQTYRRYSRPAPRPCPPRYY